MCGRCTSTVSAEPSRHRRAQTPGCGRGTGTHLSLDGPRAPGPLAQPGKDAPGLRHIPDFPGRLIEGCYGFVDINLGGAHSLVEFRQSSTQRFLEVQARLLRPEQPETSPNGSTIGDRSRRVKRHSLLHGRVVIQDKR
jgi:hypothetical protein